VKKYGTAASYSALSVPRPRRALCGKGCSCCLPALFAAVYLPSHRLAKVGLVGAALPEQLWAYPGMIALLGAFIAYQL
jgi:hypothetical protein